MKLNRTLSIMAIAFIAINFVFIVNAKSLSGGSSMIYVFIFPCVWLVTIVAAVALAIQNRKAWFSGDMILSTLVSLFFCTPIPISLLILALKPDLK